MNAYEFVAQVSRLEPYADAGDGWTPDQYEDAIDTLNKLIEMARNIDHQEGAP